MTSAPSRGGGDLLPADDPLVVALAAAIREHRTRRVPLRALRAAHARHDPTGASSHESRGRLAAALHTLEALGTIAPPRSARLYERHLLPELPLWVERPALPRMARAPEPARVWRPELAAAAALATSPAEHAVLHAVDVFLRDGGASRPVVPHRERSLELFGHEKRLDALLRTRLFTSGALSLGLMQAYVAPIPLTAQHTGDPGPTPTLLIVENHATYASALTLARARAAAGEPALAVGFGSGTQLPASIGGAAQLAPPPVDIAYFGDLDAAGLGIARSADVAARAAGLPRVRPAIPLYRELIAHGLPDPDGGPSMEAATARELTRWLSDAALIEAAVPVLVGGARLAQEAVGLERLATLTRWC